MCYSTESSWISFFISIVISIIIWKRNKNYDRWNSLFIVSFALIQLWEGFLWYFSKGQNNELNKNLKYENILLILILLTLNIQPIIQTWGAKYFTKSNSKMLRIFLIIYILIFIYSLYRIYTENFSLKIGPNGHLEWYTNNNQHILTGNYKFLGILYIFGLFFGLYFGIPNTIPLIIVGFITFLWSLFKLRKSNEFSSYWCYSAIIYSFIALIFP